MDSSKALAVAKHPLILGGTPLVLTLMILFQARGDFKEVGANIVEQVGQNSTKVEALDKTMAVLGERVDRLTDAIKNQQSDHDEIIALKTKYDALMDRVRRIENGK